MKRFENIVQSETAPNTNSLWIKDDVLKYFNNGQWVPLSYQEEGSNNNGVIDNLKEILDFLEDFDDDGTLKDFIEFQITDIRNRLNAYESSINTLEQNVSNLTTQVDSIEPYTLPVATVTKLGGVKSSIARYNDYASAYGCIYVTDSGVAQLIARDDFIINKINTAYSNNDFFTAESTGSTTTGFGVNFNIRIFDGSRNISNSATNFVLEKGLYSVINPINNSITTLTTNLSNLTDAVEGLSTTVDGIQPDTLPTNSDFITALVTQLKNNSEFKAAVKQIMDENTATTNEEQ